MAVTARASSNGRSPRRGHDRLHARAEPGRPDDPLLVQRPLAALAECRLGHLDRRLGEQPRTRPRRGAPPPCRRSRARRPRCRARASGRNPAEAPWETPVVAAPPPGPPPGPAPQPARTSPCRRDSPPPGRPRTGRLPPVEPVLDDVEVAVDQMDRLVIHREPGAADHEPPPLPRLDDRALETQGAHVVRPDRVAVVEPKVPVPGRIEKAAAARAAGGTRP